MGRLLPLSSSCFLSYWKAMATGLAKLAIASSSLTDVGGFFHGIGEGRLLGVLGSEEGSESSGSPAAGRGPFGGTFPPFPPERNISWVSRMAFRSSPISFWSRFSYAGFSMK